MNQKCLCSRNHGARKAPEHWEQSKCSRMGCTQEFYRLIHNLEVIISSTSQVETSFPVVPVFFSLCFKALKEKLVLPETDTPTEYTVLYCSSFQLIFPVLAQWDHSLAMFQRTLRLTPIHLLLFPWWFHYFPLFSLAAAALLIEVTCLVACPLFPKRN